MTSNHYVIDRMERELTIRKIGEGKRYDEFIIDRGHRNGPERHILTTTGIIIIYNLRTNKMITKLIARPQQIKRYYSNPLDYPKDIIDLAYKHTLMFLNHI